MDQDDQALSEIKSELSLQSQQITKRQNKPSEIHIHGPVTIVKDSSHVAIGDKSKVIVKTYPGTPDNVEGFQQGQEGPEDEADMGQQMESDEEEFQGFFSTTTERPKKRPGSAPRKISDGGKSTDVCTWSKRAQANQARTKDMIEYHEQKGIFLPTKAIGDGLDLLQRESVLIYTGKAGSGKTTNSIEVMQLFLRSNPEYAVFESSDIRDVEWIVIPGYRIVLLLDDILGRTNLLQYQSLINPKSRYWKIINNSINKGHLKVILTVRVHILEESLKFLESNHVFYKTHVIDLSSTERTLSVDEKLEMFNLHCNKNNISIIRNHERENYAATEILNKDEKVTIKQKRVDEIVNSDPLMGFPQAVSLFCSIRKYTRLGEKFFLHPHHELEHEMKVLYGNTDKKLTVCILVYMLLKGGTIDLDMLDNDVLQNVTDSFQLSPLPNKTVIKGAIKNISETYVIKVSRCNAYSFKHETILEAVAVSFGSYNVELLVEYCKWNVIREFIRTEGYEKRDGEVIIPLEISEYGCLVDRFMFELTTKEDHEEKFRWISHSAFDDSEFLEKFCDVIQSNPEYSSTFLKELDSILQKTCVYDKHKFLSLLFKLYNFEDLDCKDFMSLATYSSGTGVLKLLLDHKIDFSNLADSLFRADFEQLDVMLKHPNTELSYVLQVLDTYDEFEHMDADIVHILLTRWPELNTEYVDKLLCCVEREHDTEAIQLLHEFQKSKIS